MPVEPADRLVPGENYTQGQLVIAEMIRNTFVIEKNRYLSGVAPKIAANRSPEFGDRLRQAVTSTRNTKHASIEDEVLHRTTKKPKANIWIRIAQLCISRVFDPEKYVRYQFINLTSASGRRPVLPSPEHLLSSNAINRYLAGLGDLIQEIESAFTVQRSTFEIEVAVIRRRVSCTSDEDAWHIALNDVNIPLTALFRYCVARSVRDQPNTPQDQKDRFHQTVSRFAVAAAVQYVYAEDGYKAIWKEWIPPDFSAKAKAQYWKSHNIGRQGRNDG